MGDAVATQEVGGGGLDRAGWICRHGGRVQLSQLLVKRKLNGLQGAVIC